LQSIDLLERVAEISNRTLGITHPDSMQRMHALALSYHADERLVDAAKLLEDTLQRQNDVLGEEHHDTKCIAAAFNDVY